MLGRRAGTPTLERDAAHLRSVVASPGAAEGTVEVGVHENGAGAGASTGRRAPAVRDAADDVGDIFVNVHDSAQKGGRECTSWMLDSDLHIYICARSRTNRNKLLDKVSWSLDLVCIAPDRPRAHCTEGLHMHMSTTRVLLCE